MYNQCDNRKHALIKCTQLINTPWKYCNQFGNNCRFMTVYFRHFARRVLLVQCNFLADARI